MRKFQKAAVVVAMLGSVSFLGAGAAQAGEQPSFKLDNDQTNSCPASEHSAGLLNHVLDRVNVQVVANESPVNQGNIIHCTNVFGK
ncbi:hypothetical protein [Streptomyces sp. JNUCC 63]